MSREASAPVPVALTGVSKSFGAAPVVRDVSFTVARGTCFGLLGPNGAGKSTTLKMIHGFLRPDAGAVYVQGLDVAQHPREVRRWIGVAPQDDTLDPDLTAGQNLWFHARYAGNGRGRGWRHIETVLAQAGLAEHRDSPLSHLSSGMRRRLVLARALMNDPNIVILDEPTRGLDREGRTEYLDRLAELKGKGVTLLLATHELEEAEFLCDRAAIMLGGELAHEGPAREIIRAARRRNLLPANPGMAAC